MTEKEQLTKLLEQIKVLEEEKCQDKYVEPLRKKAHTLKIKLEHKNAH
jgi:hypothetical protein